LKVILSRYLFVFPSLVLYSIVYSSISCFRLPLCYLRKSLAADPTATQARLRCSYVEVRATKNIQSSSQSGCEISMSETTLELNFYVNVFFPLSLTILLSDLWVYMSNTTSVYKKLEMLSLPENLSSPSVFWWDPCCSSMYLFVLSYYLSLRSAFRVVCWYDSSFMSFSRYLCLFTYSGDQHILSCVFV
jgi:hypothetical protein